MWIDAHAHLFDYSPEECSAIVSEASAADVGRILSTATNCSNAHRVIEQCDTFAPIRGAAGISPFDVENLSVSWQDELCTFCTHPGIIAVGEIGIDSTNPRYPPLNSQLPVFEEQLAIALRYDLPVVVHSRGSEKSAAEICVRAGITKALFHCFTGDRTSLGFILEQLYHVSLSGIVTFRNSNLGEYITDIPHGQLHIETDSPYLAPVPFRGKKNRPALVGLVGKEVARIFDISETELQRQLTDNFFRLFNKCRDERIPADR